MVGCDELSGLRATSVIASKRGVVAHGDVGQDLAVEVDVGLLEAGDQLGVGRPLMRAAALIRMIHSSRMSRLRCLRSRVA